MSATHCPNGHRWDSPHAGPACPHCSPDPPWANISPAERKLLEQHCTAKQIEAFRLYRAGLGLRVIALALGVSREAVRDRLRAAELKLDRLRKAS